MSGLRIRMEYDIPGRKQQQNQNGETSESPKMLAGIEPAERRRIVHQRETVEAAVSHLMVIEGCGTVCAEVGRHGSGPFDGGVSIIPV